MSLQKTGTNNIAEDKERNTRMFVSVGPRPQAGMVAESFKSSSATVVRVAQNTQTRWENESDFVEYLGGA
jgi:hypothetical protein